MADTYGARFRNDDGYLQIDSTYRNTGLVWKRDYSITAGLANAITIAISGTSPIVAIKTNGIRVFTFGSTGNIRIAAMDSGTVTVYYFDVAQQQTVLDYGLIIKNASGQLCYDGRQKYLRVVDFKTGTSFDDETFSYSKNIAVVIAQVKFTVTILAGPNIDYPVVNEDLMMIRTYDTYFTKTKYQHALWTGTPGSTVPSWYTNYNRPYYGFLVVDVTGY